MSSGTETLASIDQTLQQVRRGMQQVDGEIQTHTQQQVQLRQEQAQQFRELARVQLDQIQQGQVISIFDDAERQVTELLQRRNEKLALLGKHAEQVQARQQDLEAERARQQERIAAASAELDAAEGVVQRELGQQPNYQQQLAQAQKADAIARHAEEKSERVENEHAERGKPYESDRLFLYLWNRRYGTSHYRGFGPFRWLDAWVARLCRYNESRPNYAALQEIPKRLKAHGERARKSADREFAALETLEVAAAEKGGIPPLRKKVEEAQTELDRIDTRIKEQEEQYQSIMNQRSRFAGGEDDDFQKSVEVLVHELQREPIPELLRRAERTPTPADNVMVRRLGDLERSHEQVEQSLARAKQLHERHLDRLQQLEKIRREFKRSRYDDIHSVFPDGAMVGAMLDSFLRGMVSSAEVWNTIQRQHRYRRVNADPTFGSGSIGGPGGGVWSFPFPPMSGGGWSGGFGGGFGGGSGGGFSFPTGGGGGGG
ncbi:MAG: hypothetical protein EHM42_12105, partial [Planctomycetaceae bacterium]